MQQFHTIPGRAIYLLLSSLLCIGLAGMAGCGGDEESNPNEPEPQPDSSAFITAVTVGGSEATYHDESIPAGGAPAPAVVGTEHIVRGGSVVLEVTTEETAEALYIGVEDAAGGLLGAGIGVRAILLDRQSGHRAAIAGRS